MTARTSQGEVILEARNISKSFPGVRALDRVDLQVRAGRLMAVVGENGAGQSTLMNILAGVLQPDEGEIYLDARRVEFREPTRGAACRHRDHFQELNLVPTLSVAENIFLRARTRQAHRVD
ncbi:MAG: ATP-binding cassette domain-containing protein [Verrucomicrobiales bacterium]|nr:ATP-binding cassette domain-containing protein [Verrucomicrobiales bacterium]